MKKTIIKAMSVMLAVVLALTVAPLSGFASSCYENGHLPGDAVVENQIAPTCTVDGCYDEVIYCSICGEEFSRECKILYVLSHTYEPVITPPTCEASGYTTYTCSMCGDLYVFDEKPATGHNIVNGVCSICGLDGDGVPISNIKLGYEGAYFGKDIHFDINDEARIYMGYIAKEECIEVFNIASSNTDVIEIKSAENRPNVFEDFHQSAYINLIIKDFGTTTITVTAPNGSSASINVTVNGSTRGVLESTAWVVVFDDDSYVSHIKINGRQYEVDVNYSKKIDFISTENNYINKEVVITFYEGKVVSIITVEDLVKAINVDISVSVKPNLPQVDYTNENIYADYVTARIYVSATARCNVPGYELVLDEFNDAYVSGVVMETSKKKILNFDGNKTTTLTVEKLIPVGKSIEVAQVNAKIVKSYKMDKDTAKEIVTLDCKVNGVYNNEVFERSSLCNINIIDNKNSKPSSLEENQNITNAVDELQKMLDDSEVSLEADYTNTLSKLLTLEQRKSIGAMILCQIALRTADKDAFKEYVSKDTWEMISSGVEEDTLEITVGVHTQYGDVGIKFVCDYTKYLLSGYKGDIYYEIISGFDLLPAPSVKSGLAGGLYGANIKDFVSFAEKVALDELKEAYSLAWGDDANKAADIIFGKTVKKILSQSKYGDFSTLVWKMLVSPAKQVVIECPVDVYVYNSNNELVAAVENNQVVLTSKKASITVEGDTKRVMLFDDSYRIEYTSLAEYDMKVTVTEYGYSDCLLRTVAIEKISLKIGINFEQVVNTSILEDSDYSLYDTKDNVYKPYSDVVALHNHQFDGEWKHIKDASCDGFGFDVALCSMCSEWCKRIISPTGHNYSSIITVPTCTTGGYTRYNCTACGDTYTADAISALGHSFENGACTVCGEKDPTITEELDHNYIFSIQNPSRTEIRNKDGIILHANVDGTAPNGSYVRWESSNGNFDKSADGSNLKIIAKNKGYTTFIAILCDADGNELARDSIEMYSKSGFFDKIGGFFRSFFGMTKIYDK